MTSKLIILEIKWDMELSSCFAEQVRVIHIETRVLLSAQEAKCFSKAVNFYPDISEFKVFAQQNN